MYSQNARRRAHTRSPRRVVARFDAGAAAVAAAVAGADVVYFAATASASGDPNAVDRDGVVDVARACVEKTMAAYEKLLESAASEDARGRVRRSMGLKMEQLRGELKMMDSAHDDH